MAGYTRNDTADNIADGKVINASDLDGEFNAVEAAFNASTGHTHDGTTGGGALISYADLTNTPDFDNIDINGGTIDGTTIGNTTAAAGTFTQVNFADNNKAIFGNSSDLQIYHDGSDSYVTDQGAGNLKVQGSSFVLIQDASGTNMLRAKTGEFVDLYYNGSAKLATTSTGIEVTGTVVADGLSLSGTAVSLSLFETDQTDLNTRFRQTTGDLFVQTLSDDSSSAISRLSLDHSTGDISFYDDTGTSQAFYWDASAESLGIGTSSPISYAKLTLEKSGGDSAIAFVKTGGAQTAYIAADGVNAWIGSSFGSTGKKFFVSLTAPDSAATIDSSGNLLVGTATQLQGANSRLNIEGDFYNANGVSLKTTNGGSGSQFIGFINESGTLIGSVNRVSATNAVAYNTTSDLRLKSNVKDAAPVLEKIMQIQVRQYDWTEGALHQDYGFIAQELDPILSGIVTKGKTENDIWQLDYSKLTPHLLKAIQEQQSIIESLKARLDAANI